MQAFDYRKFAILYVDDEEMSLKLLKTAFQQQFRLLTANRAQTALQLLEAHAPEIGVLMTDQRMPGEKGVWLLEQARQRWPGIIRILVTAYSDAEAAAAAVNAGAIHNYLFKPWDPGSLESTLRRALEWFVIEKERDELLEQKNSLLQDLLMAERVASLGFLAAGMSHYIRNWLSAVKAFIQDAPEQLQREKVDLEKLNNPEFWKDLRGMALEHISKIETLLLQLWSASHPTQLALSDQVNLGQSISEAVQKLSGRAQGAQITVETVIASALPRLQGNQASLSRLFELLLEDELVSLPPGSRIRIEGEAVPLESGQTEIRLRWRDNGPCLPNETLRRLLNFFAPRVDDPGESGIKLMLCYFIVLQHRGKMSVTSDPPLGTVFHVSFYAGGVEPESPVQP